MQHEQMLGERHNRTLIFVQYSVKQHVGKMVALGMEMVAREDGGGVDAY